MSQVPVVMKAWQYTTHGDPESVLQLVADKPVPVGGDNDVLLKVKCAALNPIGYKSIKYFPSFAVKKPAVPEMDVSGVVASVGKSVTSFKVGDEVYGIIPGEVSFKSGLGALSEYTLVAEDLLVKKSTSLSWQEASSLPLAGLTAYQALVEDGGLKAGDNIFINGGSGGVGSLAVQIAKALGANSVVSSCGTSNVEFVKELGADDVLDYKAAEIPAQLTEKYSGKPFDLIFDTIGSNPIFHSSESYLKPKALFVNVGAGIDGLVSMAKTGAALMSNMFLPAFLGGVKRTYKFTGMKATKAKLQALNDLVNEGKVKPIVDSEYAFDDVHSAYKKIMSNRARGKVVVNVSVE